MTATRDQSSSAVKGAIRVVGSDPTQGPNGPGTDEYDLSFNLAAIATVRTFETYTDVQDVGGARYRLSRADGDAVLQAMDLWLA